MLPTEHPTSIVNEEIVVTTEEATASTGYVTEVGEVGETKTLYVTEGSTHYVTDSVQETTEQTLPAGTKSPTTFFSTTEFQTTTAEMPTEFVSTTVATTTVIQEITEVTETEGVTVTTPGVTIFTSEGETVAAGTFGPTEQSTWDVEPVTEVTTAGPTESTGYITTVVNEEEINTMVVTESTAWATSAKTTESFPVTVTTIHYLGY